MKVIPILDNLNEATLATMDGNVFEQLCVDLYGLIYPNYHIQKTNVNDFGADILINMGHDRRMVVQCKTSQTNKPIGVRAVQEVIAAKNYYQATFAEVVTNSSFTPQAVELAETNMVSLIDGSTLVNKFSKTVLEIDDIPLIYEHMTNVLNSFEYTYFAKFLDQPKRVFDLSDLETVYMLKLALNKIVHTQYLELEHDLQTGVKHVLYLALCQSQKQ